MGKLKQPVRTEPIAFWETETTSDGGVGTAGELVEVHSTLAKWGILKSSRKLEASQESLKNGYWFQFWTNPGYEPSTKTIVEFRGQKYAIQQLAPVDINRRETEIIVLSV